MGRTGIGSKDHITPHNFRATLSARHLEGSHPDVTFTKRTGHKSPSVFTSYQMLRGIIGINHERTLLNLRDKRKKDEFEIYVAVKNKRVRFTSANDNQHACHARYNGDIDNKGTMRNMCDYSLSGTGDPNL